MSKTFVVLAAAAMTLSGCAGSPPRPAAPAGEFRPINRTAIFPSAPAPAYQGFEFRFSGDLQQAVLALRDTLPGLKVLDPIGNPVAVPVSLALAHANLNGAVRALNEQAGSKARVFWREWGDGQDVSRQIVVRYTK